MWPHPPWPPFLSKIWPMNELNSDLLLVGISVSKEHTATIIMVDRSKPTATLMMEGACWHRAGWCRCNTVSVSSGGAGVESQHGYYPDSGLSWYYSVPFSKCLDSASIRPSPLPPKSLPIHYSSVIQRYIAWATDCIVKEAIKYRVW
jgi:hypothetical protein